MYKSNTYRKLILQILSHNYIPSTDWTKYNLPNTFLLRHDVDFSIEYAYQLAKIEESIDVSSTFFFMLTSNMYNIFSTINQALIKDIAQMGHKISVHFDPTVYSSLDSFLFEKEAFENIFNIEVDIASIHRPGIFLNNNDLSLCGINQTYQDKYFKNMKYISDSGGRNILPILDSFLSDNQNKGLHLLVHPIWWCEESKSPTHTLNTWKKKNTNFITSEIRSNCKTYLD